MAGTKLPGKALSLHQAINCLVCCFILREELNFKFISFLYITISSTSLTGGENSVKSKTERMTLSKRLGGALSLAMAHNEGFLDKRSSRSGPSSANSSTGGIVGALD